MVCLYIYLNYVIDLLINLAVANDGQNVLAGCSCGCGGRTPASRRPVGNRDLSGQLAGAAGTGRHPTMVIMVA